MDLDNWPDHFWCLSGPPEEDSSAPRIPLLLTEIYIDRNMQPEDRTMYRSFIMWINETIPAIIERQAKALDDLYRERLQDFIIMNDSDPVTGVSDRAVTYITTACDICCLQQTMRWRFAKFNGTVQGAVTDYLRLAVANPASPELRQLGSFILNLCNALMRQCSRVSNFILVEKDRRFADLLSLYQGELQLQHVD